jgi:hypothetical protein
MASGYIPARLPDKRRSNRRLLRFAILARQLRVAAENPSVTLREGAKDAISDIGMLSA